jgi:serine/threonine protein kinase
MIGKEVGPYKILEKIGQGGMGIVYQGIHTQLEQKVAIKFLSPEYAHDPSMRERFIAEAKLQAKLTHPHVVNIFNYLQDAGDVFLIMEYIDGPTLERRLATAGSLAEQEAASIGQDVLAALSFMHSRGVIHRDIKPGNIMFTETGLVKVTDFGIAKVAGEKGQTKTGMRLGTLGYMAPEQIQGKPASVASDLYTLGITLYQMVTGRLPFRGNSEYTIMRSHIEEAPEPPWEINPRISRELGHVILKALEKKPEHRYRDAREFADALASIARPPYELEVATPVPVDPRSPRSLALQLNAWRYTTLFVSAGILLTILLYFVFFHGGQQLAIPLATGLVPPTTLNPVLTAGIEPSHLTREPAPSPQGGPPVEESDAAVEGRPGDTPREAEPSPTEEPLPQEAVSTPPEGDGVEVTRQEGNASQEEAIQAPSQADSPADVLPAVSQTDESSVEGQEVQQDGHPQEKRSAKKRGRKTPAPIACERKEMPKRSGGWYVRK